MFYALSTRELCRGNDYFEKTWSISPGTKILTDDLEVRLQRRHVQVVERCDGDVYSCFNDPKVQSHNLRRPSGVKSAKNRPFLSKEQQLPSIFHTPFARGISKSRTHSPWQTMAEKRNGNDKRYWGSSMGIIFRNIKGEMPVRSNQEPVPMGHSAWSNTLHWHYTNLSPGSCAPAWISLKKKKLEYQVETDKEFWVVLTI